MDLQLREQSMCSETFHRDQQRQKTSPTANVLNGVWTSKHMATAEYTNHSREPDGNIFHKGCKVLHRF